MAATVTISNTVPIDATQENFEVYGTVALTGNYPANGDTVSFAGLGLPSNSVPVKVEFFETTPAPGPASGRGFVYVPGTTQSNGLIEVFAGNTQFGAGAYGTPPFAITGFQLSFKATFASFI